MLLQNVKKKQNRHPELQKLGVFHLGLFGIMRLYLKIFGLHQRVPSSREKGTPARRAQARLGLIAHCLASLDCSLFILPTLASPFAPLRSAHGDLALMSKPLFPTTTVLLQTQEHSHTHAHILTLTSKCIKKFYIKLN